MGLFEDCLKAILEYKDLKNAPKELFEKIAKLCDANYRYRGLLGDGGESIVLHCVDTILQREIALKIFLPYVSEKSTIFYRNKSKERFFRGFQLQQKLHRILLLSTVPDVLSYRYDNNPFIVMEYIDGIHLFNFIHDKNITDTIRIFVKLAKAIDEVHSFGIPHRDIKSDNILVTKNERIALLDWGIAFDLLSKQDRLTRTNEKLGSPITMSPEQSKNAALSDFRSDIYSLGCVIHQMVTKHEPDKIDQKTGLAIYNPTELPMELMPIFIKATQYNMEDRYQTINEMLKSIFALYPDLESMERTKRIVQKLELSDDDFIGEFPEGKITSEDSKVTAVELTELQRAFIKSVQVANKYLSQNGEI